MLKFTSYGETLQHKVRVIRPAQSNSVEVYGMSLPRELGKKYAGVLFTVTEDFRGMIVLQSGAKVNGK